MGKFQEPLPRNMSFKGGRPFVSFPIRCAEPALAEVYRCGGVLSGWLFSYAVPPSLLSLQEMTGLKLLDWTCATPAENLACDEALLDACEANGDADILRFWQADEAFVVLGYGNRTELEVDIQGCKRRGIPILRRCSGGGAVVQLPGCLNYSLVLNFERSPALQGVTEANCYIMRRNRDAVSAVVGGPVSIKGTTDLALGELKFSGNSQRRKRRWLLFHGTFLLNCDLNLIQDC